MPHLYRTPSSNHKGVKEFACAQEFGVEKKQMDSGFLDFAFGVILFPSRTSFVIPISTPRCDPFACSLQALSFRECSCRSTASRSDIRRVSWDR